MEDLLHQYRQKQHEAALEALKCTCPFLTEDKRGYIKGDGCGVLITIDSHCFLITAAHVIDGLMDKMYVPIGQDDAIELGGEMVINNANSRDRQNDEIDVGIIKLCEKSIQSLKLNYQFLTETDLEINHKTKLLPQYISSAYPVSRTKQKYNSDVISADPFIYITMPAEKSVYRRLGYSKAKSIVVHYGQNAVLNVRTRENLTGPNPSGISGSGLWHIPIQSIDSEMDSLKKLVAILIHWSYKDKGYWLSTRIDVFTEIIRQKFNLNFPSSKTVKVII